MPIASNSVASFTRMGFNEQIQALSFFPTSLSVLLFFFSLSFCFLFLFIINKDSFSYSAEQWCYSFLVLRVLMGVGQWGHPVMAEIILQVDKNISLWFITQCTGSPLPHVSCSRVPAVGILGKCF